jgi:hypothetical protein
MGRQQSLGKWPLGMQRRWEDLKETSSEDRRWMELAYDHI